MKSMTGYAYLEDQDPEFRVSVELKAWNNKYLDINLYTSPLCAGLDEVFRGLVASKVLRGCVDCSVKVHALGAMKPWTLDEALFLQGLSLLRRAKELAADPGPVKVESVLALEGVLRQEDHRDLEKVRAAVEPVFVRALDLLDQSRQEEGRGTRDDIVRMLETIRVARDRIAAKAEGLEQSFRDTLRRRFAETLGDLVDENRMLQELAVMLTRYSIHEELTRLELHLRTARDLVDRGEGVAKRLEFISQEMNREANTIGSKSVDSEVSESVIDIKEAIDGIREQVRNIE